MLDKAFRDAVTEINVNSIDDEDILEDVLATSMKAYAEREMLSLLTMRSGQLSLPVLKPSEKQGKISHTRTK